MFVSSLDSEGDGHFLGTVGHHFGRNDNLARAPSNECISGDCGACFYRFSANSLIFGKFLPFFVVDNALVLYDVEVNRGIRLP